MDKFRAPLPAFHYEVAWPKIHGKLSFHTISGLRLWKETQNRQKTVSASDEFVSLKRGIFVNEQYLPHFSKFMNEGRKADIEVHLLDEDRKPAFTWILSSASIVEIKFTDLESTVNKLAEYELVLSYKTIEFKPTKKV